MKHLAFTLAAGWSFTGFAAYYFLSANQGLSSRIWRNESLDLRIRTVIMQRLWGLLFLGVISVLIIVLILKESLFNYGLGFGFSAPVPWWAWAIMAVIPLLSFLQASSAGNLRLYPQIRVEKWSPGILILNSLSWIIFLLAYEFMFRGFLLFASLQLMDMTPAIALNTAVYSLAHLYKGPGEAFGALPVGIILCYLSILTGNIWMAVILHSTMALTNEWFSLRAHPQMHLAKK